MMPINIFTPSRSLAAKITLWVTAAMLMTFVVITLFIYRTTADGIFMEANARYQGLLDNNNEEVNATLKAVEVAIGNNVPLVEESLNRPDQLYNIVKRILTLNPDIVGSAIAFEPEYYKDKGQWFAPYAYRQGNAIKVIQLGSADYEYHYMDWYQIPKHLGKAYWSEPYYDQNGGNMLMTTYSLPLLDNDGRMYAIFTADIALEWLSSMMQQTDSINNSEQEMGEGNAYSFIIGRSGTYIAHPDHERVANETFFSYTMQTPDSTDELTGYKMINGEEGNAVFHYNGRFRVYYSPIERTGWSMAIVVPEKELLAVANRTGLVIITLMIIGLIIVFFVCHYTIGLITKPLTRFADSADEIAQGNFDAPLPAVKTRDEMGRLHDSFYTMQQSLNRQIKETIRINGQKNRIESELQIAQAIQMAMLPKTFPPFPTCNEVAIYGRLNPAREVGGDLYDFCIRDGMLFYCIGDVSGKGVPASLLMAATRTLFRTIAAHESQPKRIVSMLNDSIAEDNEMNMFVTLFVGMIDLTTGRMLYCNAGHDAPLLISNDGRHVGQLPVIPNLPAGAFYGRNYSEQETVIDSGTTIFLFTDGLTEAMNNSNEAFGEQRLFDIAQNISKEPEKMTPRLLIDQMTEAVHAYVGDAEQSDDLTMMSIQYTRQHDDGCVRRSLALYNDVKYTSKLSEYVEAIAIEKNFEEDLKAEIQLALEEAVVNVMSYAYPEGTVGIVNINGTIDNEWATFVVTDSGIPFDPLTKEEPDITLPAEDRPIGGLGIFMVRHIMDEVIYKRQDGKNMLTLKKKITKN